MRKILPVILLVLLSLSLIGCARNAERITREEAMPIQHVIDGVLNNNPQTYRQAFPPDYDAAVEAEEAMWKYEATPPYTNFNSYLSDIFNSVALAHKENYGKKVKMEFVVTDVSTIDPANYPDYFDRYYDNNIYYYEIDMSATTKAATVTGSLNIWGSKGEESKKAEFVVLQINGVWYLHPVYYYTTLY